jgi:hypothetical protein
LDVKYKHVAAELVWQQLFPAKTLTVVPRTGEHRRLHLHEFHQELLRQSDVRTLMIYTHTIPSVTIKAAKSTLALQPL